MDRNDFQKLAQMRFDEAKVLRDNGRFDGAYYLAGYSVECALKACIARRTRPEEFPPKWQVVRGYYTHDINTLLKAAELEDERNVKARNDSTFQSNWSIVAQWNEDARYQFHTRPTAEELIDAIEDPSHGVLPWLQSFW